MLPRQRKLHRAANAKNNLEFAASYVENSRLFLNELLVNYLVISFPGALGHLVHLDTRRASRVREFEQFSGASINVAMMARTIDESPWEMQRSRLDCWYCFISLAMQSRD